LDISGRSTNYQAVFWFVDVVAGFLAQKTGGRRNTKSLLILGLFQEVNPA
jgi:hypothetical protein